jgi:hypothetical protein
MNYFDRTVQILAYVAVAIIIVLSLVPGSARPQTGAPGQGEHVIAYLITAFLFGLRSTSISNLIAPGIVLVAGAGALEAAQQWVPGRNAQLGDFIASSIGIIVGLAAGGALCPLYRRVLKTLP